MATHTQQQALGLVLAHEGGYVNHPKDPGGPTNRGVTQRVYDAYRQNKGLASRSVRLIDALELYEIYDRQYWDAVKADKLPAGLDYAVFDYAVNSGPQRAVKDLQRALNDNANYYGISGNISTDGVMGQLTLAAAIQAASVNEVELISRYCERRMTFLRSLRTWKTFGKGWKRRVVGNTEGSQKGDIGVLDYAVMMIKPKTAARIETMLPTAIGDKPKEVNGKGVEANQAALKTKGGAGSAIATMGLTGQTVISYAQEVQPHIGETLIGRLALVGFILMMAAGVGLFAWDWWQKQQEKAAS